MSGLLSAGGAGHKHCSALQNVQQRGSWRHCWRLGLAALLAVGEKPWRPLRETDQMGRQGAANRPENAASPRLRTCYGLDIA